MGMVRALRKLISDLPAAAAAGCRCIAAAAGCRCIAASPGRIALDEFQGRK